MAQIKPKTVMELFEKRILRRKFKRKQRNCLKEWFDEWKKLNPEEFENVTEDNYEDCLKEISDSFFDWAEANKTLDPKIWGTTK